MVTHSVELVPLRGVPSERVRRIKERLLSSLYELDIERARHYTKIWRQMEDASPCMRTVSALEEVLRKMPIRIDDDELLVGVKSIKVRADPFEIERGSNVAVYDLLLDESIGEQAKSALSFIRSSGKKKAELTKEELEELKREIIPFWKGKTLRDRKLELLQKEGLYEEPSGPGARITSVILSELPDYILILSNLQGHLIPGYKQVLKIGFKGIAKKAAQELEKLEKDEEDYEQRRDFLESVQIAARAVCDYSNRYADLAEKMAESERGERKAELLEIAERVERVPANPPRIFMEALQSLWMTNVVLEISYGEGNVFSQGRVDQYLYPYYESDLKAERITHEKAVEAVEEYLVKLASVVIAGQNNITLGGVDQTGEDATNEVSYIFLEALANVKALLNTISVRISSKTPRDFLKKALEVHRYTAGMAFYNDELIIDQLQKDGYSLEDARDYSIVGCVEPTGTGNDFSYTGGNGIFPTIILLMALNEGCVLLPSGNRRVGVATPDPSTFKTFEDVKEAFVKQLSFIIDKLVRMAELKDQAFAEAFPCVLVSSTIEGCLESGKDITGGGARYNNSCGNGQGLATVANSLAAIRWAVFEQKLVTMGELVNHLRNNFKDAEKLRQKLLHQAPKYGNGDEKADELAEWVAEVFSQEVRKHKCGRGGIYRPSLVSAAGSQIVEGKLCGATPDGRLSGEAVSNGMSPANGTEVNGMTAALRSAAQAGKALLTDGTAMNLRISPSLLRKDENIDKMASLVEGYFKLGGRNVQFNPLDTATLKDAQAHPEKYPDLTVKVSGYSARFIDLSKYLQDDIIGRTEFGKM